MSVTSVTWGQVKRKVKISSFFLNKRFPQGEIIPLCDCEVVNIYNISIGFYFVEYTFRQVFVLACFIIDFVMKKRNTVFISVHANSMFSS